MKRHIKRLLAPKFWRVPKKKTFWVTCPRSGPHKKKESIPLMIIIRDILKLVDTGNDAKKIIKSKEIFVDGKPRKDHKYPVGLFDVIEIPKMNKYYRVIPTPKDLTLIEITKNEAKLKLCRIKNKSIIKGGQLQLNLYDGKNIILTTKKETYKTGDSILIELPSQNIIKHFKMEKDSAAIITGGQNMGELVKIKEIVIRRTREPNKVMCKGKEKEFEAIMNYVFIVGKDKPEIKVIQ